MQQDGVDLIGRFIAGTGRREVRRVGRGRVCNKDKERAKKKKKERRERVNLIYLRQMRNTQINMKYS